MSERDTGKGTRCHGRGYARDDFEAHPGCPQGQGFLRTAGKQQRVTALEPNHTFALLRKFNELIGNQMLGRGALASSLSHITNFGLRAQLQQVGMTERVEKHHIGLLE